jgi:hypothetical protein
MISGVFLRPIEIDRDKRRNDQTAGSNAIAFTALAANARLKHQLKEQLKHQGETSCPSQKIAQ